MTDTRRVVGTRGGRTGRARWREAGGRSRIRRWRRRIGQHRRRAVRGDGGTVPALGKRTVGGDTRRTGTESVDKQVKFDTPRGVKRRTLPSCTSVTRSNRDTPSDVGDCRRMGIVHKISTGHIACVLTTKTITDASSPYIGPAVLIHDGDPSTFGYRSVVLRRAASAQFDGFGRRVTPVYTTCLRNADRTYPEVMAADYISGYLKSRIESVGVAGVSYSIERIDSSWTAPSDRAPRTAVEIRPRRRRNRQTKIDRVAAWIGGTRPADGDAWGGVSRRSLVRGLNSKRLREYLLTEL